MVIVLKRHPHLEEVSVVFLNLGLIVHPNFHPETFLLAVATHSIPVVSLIDLSVLQFPGLMNLSIITTL